MFKQEKLGILVWGAESWSQTWILILGPQKCSNKRDSEFWCEGLKHEAKNELIHLAQTNVQTREIGNSGVRGQILLSLSHTSSKKKCEFWWEGKNWGRMWERRPILSTITKFKIWLERRNTLSSRNRARPSYKATDHPRVIANSGERGLYEVRLRMETLRQSHWSTK